MHSQATVIRADQIFMSLWLIKVLTLIFLRNIPQPGLSLSLPRGLGQVRRGPGSISWRFHFLEVQGIRLKGKEAKTAQEQGAGNSQASPVLTTNPTLPEPPGREANRAALCSVLGPRDQQRGSLSGFTSQIHH